MLLFLIPLFLSFVFNIASAFTAAYSRRLGRRGGQLASIVLRDLLGLPLLGVAFVLAAAVPAQHVFPEFTWLVILGRLLIVFGAILIIWAVWALRRRSVAPSLTDTLVRHGPFAFVRHPLYSGVYSELAGFILLRPTWPVVACCIFTAAGLQLQARVEEKDLQQRIPGYRDYMHQVSRFFPHLKR